MIKMKVEIKEVVGQLVELQEDVSVPRNIKDRLQETIKSLQENCEVSIRIDRARQQLDEIGNDANLQPYARTQIWCVVSMLENV